MGVRDLSGSLPPGTKLIFLVGASRSGTTWLQLMLSASADIATARETRLFYQFTRSLFSTWRYYDEFKRTSGIHDIMTESEFFSLIHDLAENVLARILLKKPGATIVLEKTPGHALYWRDILAVFPDAKFLHVIRDPRAVVASLRAARNGGWGSWWVSPRISDNCRMWMSHVNAARQIPSATNNYLEVRYEDLKGDGLRTLRSIFTWCGVDISEMETLKIQQQHEIDTLRPSKLAKFYGGNAQSFFRKGEVDSWRQDLTHREIALIERFTGDLMAELGYARATTKDSRWQTVTNLPAAAVDWLCGGLAWRLRKYSDTLSRRR